MTRSAFQSSARTLDSFVEGRDNNFNLLRFLAASAVLASHSFALSSGTSSSEPWHTSLGITPGSTAVEIFFLTSGFLVTASLTRRKDARSFIFARALRIYPGLAVSVLMTVSFVGIFFSSLGPLQFFSEIDTWTYWARTSTLIGNIGYSLPGAFESNPWRIAVNGSLWTLPYEVTMYGILLLVWVITTKYKSNRLSFENSILVVAALSITAHLLLVGMVSSSAIRLGAMFFIGSTFFVLKDFVSLDIRIFFTLLAAVFLSAFDKRIFSYIYPLALPYLVFYLAYAPGGFLRFFNRLGDYSYGVYIYAWPVQQMTAALVEKIEPLQMFTLSFPVTILLAIGSWHIVEKPALSRKWLALRGFK